jgi:SAM-dependent methyltransferase
MTLEFKSLASNYNQFRPNYPETLLDFVIDADVSDRKAAWDVATGNFQIANYLSHKYRKVWANDIVQEQLDAGQAADNVFSVCAPAELMPIIQDGSVDLIVCGQALHWIEMNSFYSEVKRTSKPGTVIAILGYGRPKTEVAAIEDILNEHYNEMVTGGFRDLKLKDLDTEYAHIPFPFDEIKLPAFQTEMSWSVDHIIGYLRSSEMITRAIHSTGIDPLIEIQNKLGKLSIKAPIKFCQSYFGRLGIV